MKEFFSRIACALGAHPKVKLLATQMLVTEDASLVQGHFFECETCGRMYYREL